MQTPLLLIDGNNLAHFLYTNLLPGQKMTQEDGLRLVKHLASYARNKHGEVEVELCLDRSPGALPETPSNLRIFSAEYPQTGDDFLLERFAFHHFSSRPCLVITNDEDVLDEVRRLGGSTLKVTDFVRRAGTSKPVLRDPDDLPPVTVPGENTADGFSSSSYSGRSDRPKKKRKRGLTDALPESASLPSIPTTVNPAEKATLPSANRIDQEQPAQTPNDATPSGPFYRLTLDAWPAREGARFLRNAFCPRHSKEHHELLEAVDPETATTRDLHDLAALLLESCGGEKDFGRTGALMNRVRLALLKAGGGPLPLSQLAERMDLKEVGLRGRIKEKAGSWIQIIEVENPLNSETVF